MPGRAIHVPHTCLSVCIKPCCTRSLALHMPLLVNSLRSYTPTNPAAVVLAVLAFFALRPGKGWLRHKPTAAAMEDGKEQHTDGSSETSSAAAMGGQQGNGKASAVGAPHAGAATVGPLKAAWTSSTLGPDTLLPYSRAAGAPSNNHAFAPAPTEPAQPPPSHVSSAGWASGGAQPGPQPLPNSYISSAGLPGGAGAAWGPVTHSHSSR